MCAPCPWHGRACVSRALARGRGQLGDCTGSGAHVTHDVQGGDINLNSGDGGESVYGGDFVDENLRGCLPHKAGVVSMANTGTSNTNNSQFFLLHAPQPDLDGEHIAFGTLLPESLAVVRKLCAVAADEEDRPTEVITITDCGTC